MASNVKYEFGVGCLLLVALGVAGFMALQIGALSSLGTKVDASVTLEDAAGLTSGAAVSIAGVEVGSVAALRVEHDVAIASLRLDPAANVRTDAKAIVRARSLLGEKYIEIVPVSRDAPLLKSGDSLGRVGPQIEIDELVNAIGPLVGALDPDTVRAVMASLSEAMAEDPERVARMLVNLDTALANTAEASAELPGLAREVRATVAKADRTLGTVDRRADEIRPLIARADALLLDLRASSEPLPEVIAKVDRLLADAQVILNDLEGSGKDVGGLLDLAAEIDEDWVKAMLRDEGVRIRFFNRKRAERASGR